MTDLPVVGGTRTCPSCARLFAMLHICELCGCCDEPDLPRDAGRMPCCLGTCEPQDWRADAELLRDAGLFETVETAMDVVMSIPNLPTRRPPQSHDFDQHYFHGGAKVGGYAGAGYRDFPVHWTTYHHVMQRQPKGVLELGCGRGYLLKRFADFARIPVMGLEISEHCALTRAIGRDGSSAFVTRDVADAFAGPWPVADQQFDLCLSVAFLEHVPEERLPFVFSEMARTCARGLHGIDVHDDDHFDQTHHTIRPLEWWRERLPPGHEAVDKETLEPPGPPVLPAGPDRVDVGVKLNLGSFTHMFHGWRNLDRIDLGGWARSNGYLFATCDLEAPLPYDDGVIDLIFLSHVLEHFDYPTGARLLRECHRVLRPGGVIRVAVPDTHKLVKLYLADELDSLREICGLDLESVGAAGQGASPIAILQEMLSGGGEHRALYDRDALVRTLCTAGFGIVATQGFRESLSEKMVRETIDLYPTMSLYVEAQR